MLTILLPLILITAVYVLLYQRAVNKFITDSYARQAVVLNDSKSVIRYRLLEAQNDIQFMAINVVVKQFLDSGQAKDRQLMALFLIDLMNIRHTLFDQLRYLDETGQEVVRINNTPQGAVVVALEQLQNKNHRDYFQHSILLNAEQVYLSNFDLNIEHGQIEQPFKPTLRIAARAIDSQGQPRGVMVVNFLGQSLLDQMRDIHQSAEMEFWMLNDQGDWLVASQPNQEWGFLFPEQAYRPFSTEYESIWKSMQAITHSDVIRIPEAENLMSVLRFSPEHDLIQDDFHFKGYPNQAWYLIARLPSQSLATHKSALFKFYGFFYVLLSGVVIILGLGLAVLMQRRRDTHQSMIRQEQEFKGLLESAPDSIIVINHQGHIVMANAQTESNFGWPRSELIGQSMEKLIPMQYQEQNQYDLADYMADPKTQAMAYGRILFACRADGQSFPVTIGLSTYSIDNECRMIAVIRDMSEMYHLIEAEQETNQKLKQAIHQLADTHRALYASHQELESFSYSVSHDLRTPLRAIDGFSTILLQSYKDQLDEQGRDFLTRMRAAAQNMSRLIDDMLMLSRIGRTDLERESFDLSELVNQVVVQLRESFPDRQVEAVIQPGIQANGDPRLMRIVMNNLLGNAWKFTGKTPQARVEFGSEKYAGQNFYFVRDNGAGFDMAYADKLFAAFQRLHQSVEFPGSGIGLATVLRIIHKHGGQIKAEGIVGQGATFRFTLP